MGVVTHLFVRSRVAKGGRKLMRTATQLEVCMIEEYLTHYYYYYYSLSIVKPLVAIQDKVL